ncbi:MAG: Lrp/AsnC family transcriptional regulator [candidate division WOR-3 bacterium]|nr:MAG: Lrp/AsnC family transcriptional regulator [candidate division WOR-3 bacterium]
MIIDPIDLNLIRQLELQGTIPVHDFFSKFHVSRKEILTRIKNFEETGFISSYGFKLFLPGIHGGKWYWGCIAGEATSKFRLGETIPFLEEMVENLSFPPGVCPNISLLFYAKNLKEIKQLSHKLTGVKYSEVYKVGEYNIAMPRVLLKDDWKLIDDFCNTTKISYSMIHSLLNNPKSGREMELSRLIWTRKNRQGILSIAPNFNWNIIKNYMHIHLAIVTNIRVKEIHRILKDIGYVGNIASRFKKRYLQVEFDLWGFSDFRIVVQALSRIERLTIEGCSFAYRNRVYDDWVKDYVQDQI